MIVDTVGVGGSNNQADVRTTQRLVNFMNPPSRLGVDGLYGSNTGKGIVWAQQQIGGSAAVDGLLEPGDPHVAGMVVRVPSNLTLDTVGLIFSNARLPLVEKYWAHLEPAMMRYEINTPMRQAHFLSQIGHESGELRYNEELATGAAYEGRGDLGNTEAGDGVRFKGRGLIQLTGRANYTSYGHYRGLNLTDGDNPKQVADDPDMAVDAACWFWKTRGINALADRDDVRSVTRRINGGTNGLDDRIRLLQRARTVLRA